MNGPGDVGGWFRTAAEPGVATRVTAWTPGQDGFGIVSPDGDVARAFTALDSQPTMVLTGAGMSTDSGLPDYRGRDAVPRTPMTLQEFMGSHVSRQRYWARSTIGWRSFGRAEPNSAHRALASLASLIPIRGIVTQNVDSLHQRAGSDPVIDLHGTLGTVVCLGCGRRSARSGLQETLLEINPSFACRIDELAEQVRTAPDGDAEVDTTSAFAYPGCEECGGILKPDVVFFGENTRREVVAAANHLLDSCTVLLVLGTSLSVMSGLRFVRRAAKEGRTVIIANDGATRGDELATERLHGRLAPLLSRWTDLARGLDSRDAPPTP